jgi:hypothetical protein
MKTFTRRFYVDLYSCGVTLNISDNIQKAHHRYEKKFGEWELAGDATVESCACFGLNEYGIFFRWSRVTHSALAHEIFHISRKILFDRSVGLADDEICEPLAYLIDFVTQKVYHILKKNHIAIKNQ